jgi:hypothetical protein
MKENENVTISARTHCHIVFKIDTTFQFMEESTIHLEIISTLDIFLFKLDWKETKKICLWDINI